MKEQCEFMEIITKGQYYYPAIKHYGEKGKVICDLCHEKDIIACIGYKDKDLCMSCVANLLKQKNIINPFVRSKDFFDKWY